MLGTRISSLQKREALRKRIAARELTVMPGAFSPLTARMVERHGFQGIYLSGHMIAASLGLPDIGLTTSTEIGAFAAAVTRVTDQPVLIDADTGFGPGLCASRTVQLLEEAGVAGCHVEDQEEPKRVGGAAGVRVVSPKQGAARIAAALAGRRAPEFLIVARTDAMAIEGLDMALDRARRYRDVGADVLFVEGLRSRRDIEAARKAIEAPLLVNANDQSSLALKSRDFAELGIEIVIHPLALLRLALGAADEGLAELVSEGSINALRERMQAPARLADILDTPSYETRTVPGGR